MIEGSLSRISPNLFARIFDEIFPNSCRTDIGRISEIRFEKDPSSPFFGIIEIIAFSTSLELTQFKRHVYKAGENADQWRVWIVRQKFH